MLPLAQAFDCLPLCLQLLRYTVLPKPDTPKALHAIALTVSDSLPTKIFPTLFSLAVLSCSCLAALVQSILLLHKGASFFCASSAARFDVLVHVDWLHVDLASSTSAAL